MNEGILPGPAGRAVVSAILMLALRSALQRETSPCPQGPDGQAKARALGAQKEGFTPQFGGSCLKKF